jgi:hypothetical protein
MIESHTYSLLPDVAGDPSTGADLCGELRRVHAESVRYWETFPTSSFGAPLAPGAWSAAQQVRHLTKSMWPVTLGLYSPRPALRALFGRATTPSRSFVELRERYTSVLGRGAKAPVIFVPRSRGTADSTDAARRSIMARHALAVDALCAAIARWPEDTLDVYRVPHPLLGRLTIREMLRFILYHNVHHVHVAERRRMERTA